MLAAHHQDRVLPARQQARGVSSATLAGHANPPTKAMPDDPPSLVSDRSDDGYQSDGSDESANFKSIIRKHDSDRAARAQLGIVDSYIDESAIDDSDNSSDWEDEPSGPNPSADNQLVFNRVGPTPNVTLQPSRPSLLSLMFADEGQHMKAHSSRPLRRMLASPQHSQTVQNPSTISNSPDDFDEGIQMKKVKREPIRITIINKIHPSTAVSIPACAQPISRRATRRNMLGAELTVSLRRQLLWERQQKTSTANAVLKRRHTSHDVANLKQYPEKVHMNKAAAEPSMDWNRYFKLNNQGGYYAQGW